MKPKTERALRVVGTSSEVLADDAPESPAEHVARVASKEVERLEGVVAALTDKNAALREQIATLQGAQSVYALTEGGMAVVRQGEILAKLDQILAGQDRAAQVLTALSLDHVTRAEFDLLKSEHYGLSGRVPV